MAEVQKDVRLYYQGVDITDEVDIIECVMQDRSGAAADCLNLKVDHADEWFRWGTQKNDKIRVTRAGYDSKTMFLNTIVPEDGAYRIYATGTKAVPFAARWQAFEKMQFQAIMAGCAGECGMGFGSWGVNAGEYRYLMRQNESAPVFMERLANREGAVLKSMDGRFTAIGILYAQGLQAMHTVELEDDQLDSEYIDRRDLSWSGVEIRSLFGNGKAKDATAGGAQNRVITDLCVEDDATAYRWAKGILMNHNRQSEILNLTMDFNPGYTAMVHIKVSSQTDAKGDWVIDRVEQDLLNGRTKARMLRSVTGIG